jgi:hypothetical protein
VFEPTEQGAQTGGESPVWELLGGEIAAEHHARRTWAAFSAVSSSEAIVIRWPANG